MNRKNRLTSSADIRRVRRTGKSTAHPLFVIIAAPNQIGATRFGVLAGKGVGNAVQRNRAKRRLRAALRIWLERIRPGCDLVCIARASLLSAEWAEIQDALGSCLKKSGAVQDSGSGQNEV